jgi:DNA polymerase-3 subunit gamma/tau
LQDEKQQAAVQAITDDPNVRALQEKFNARVNPASIRPKV